MCRRWFLLALLCSSNIAIAHPSCPPQPMPPAIDSADTPGGNRFTHSIAFAATPSLELPGRAWVVRLDRTPRRGDGTVEIIRLRRQSTCNRYDIEKRWRAELNAEHYRIIAEGIVPLVMPPADLFTGKSPARTPEIILDGTGLELEVRGEGWRVRRLLHASSHDGAAASALIYRLVATLIPAEDLPTDEWRFRKTPKVQAGSVTGPGTAR